MLRDTLSSWRNIMNYNLKEMVSNNKKVHFQFYRKGELYYKTECGFEFPVPCSDTGDGVFNNQDRAITYMRWIRKQIKSINEGLELQA